MFLPLRSWRPNQRAILFLKNFEIVKQIEYQKQILLGYQNTVEQSHSIERVQITSLKIILGPKYLNYSNALEECGLQPLSERRDARCLQFGLKCLVHPVHQRMFPVNPQLENQTTNTRNQEHFHVNIAKSESYRMSAIPYIQRN